MPKVITDALGLTRGAPNRSRPRYRPSSKLLTWSSKSAQHEDTDNVEAHSISTKSSLRRLTLNPFIHLNNSLLKLTNDFPNTLLEGLHTDKNDRQNRKTIHDILHEEPHISRHTVLPNGTKANDDAQRNLQNNVPPQLTPQQPQLHRRHRSLPQIPPLPNLPPSKSAEADASPIQLLVTPPTPFHKAPNPIPIFDPNATYYAITYQTPLGPQRGYTTSFRKTLHFLYLIPHGWRIDTILGAHIDPLDSPFPYTPNICKRKPKIGNEYSAQIDGERRWKSIAQDMGIVEGDGGWHPRHTDVTRGLWRTYRRLPRSQREGIASWLERWDDINTKRARDEVLRREDDERKARCRAQEMETRRGYERICEEAWERARRIGVNFENDEQDSKKEDE